MVIRLCTFVFTLWLFLASECDALEPGYYLPKATIPHDAKRTAFTREFHEVQNSADACLYVESIDRIRIFRKKLKTNNPSVWHTRDEVTASLKNFDPKRLLIAWVGTSAMWSE
jgi:hypothetical protein